MNQIIFPYARPFDLYLEIKGIDHALNEQEETEFINQYYEASNKTLRKRLQSLYHDSLDKFNDLVRQGKPIILQEFQNLTKQLKPTMPFPYMTLYYNQNARELREQFGEEDLHQKVKDKWDAQSSRKKNQIIQDYQQKVEEYHQNEALWRQNNPQLVEEIKMKSMKKRLEREKEIKPRKYKKNNELQNQ